MVAIRPGDPDCATEAKVVYRVETAIPYVPTPVAKGNLVFLWQDHGIVSCLDAPTGKVHWRERVGGDYFCSPVRIADRIYCASRTGEMVVLAASERYKLMARFPLGERTNSTPAVADGTMYVRTVSHMMAIGGGGK
jgi:outer membrane protein assembly factor BamB